MLNDVEYNMVQVAEVSINRVEHIVVDMMSVLSVLHNSMVFGFWYQPA